MRTLLYIVLMSSAALLAKGQTTGSVTYHQNPKVDSLVNFYEHDRKDDPLVQGYRIQIASGSSRDAIYKVKSAFYAKFPDLRPDIVYQQPYFKLRVGYFRSKLEAYDQLLQVREHYPDAFIIRDKIDPEDLNQ